MLCVTNLCYTQHTDLNGSGVAKHAAAAADPAVEAAVLDSHMDAAAAAAAAPVSDIPGLQSWQQQQQWDSSYLNGHAAYHSQIQQQQQKAVGSGGTKGNARKRAGSSSSGQVGIFKRLSLLCLSSPLFFFFLSSPIIFSAHHDTSPHLYPHASFHLILSLFLYRSLSSYHTTCHVVAASTSTSNLDPASSSSFTIRPAQ